MSDLVKRVSRHQGVAGIVTLKKKIQIWRLPRPDDMEPYENIYIEDI
jgi:hypothetical protein